MLRPALVVLIVLLALPAVADARLTDERLAAARATAEAIFPDTCEDVWIIGKRLGDQLNGGAVADTCTVLLNSRWREWDYQKLCTIIVHEYGHLAGLEHVDDPAALMYPLYVAPTAACAAEPPVRGESRVTTKRRPRTARGWVRLRQRQYDHARRRVSFWARLDAPGKRAEWRDVARRTLRSKRRWMRHVRR